MVENIIELLIKAQYKLPNDLDTIYSITALHATKAIIVSNFGVWVAVLNSDEFGFTIYCIHNN